MKTRGELKLIFGRVTVLRILVPKVRELVIDMNGQGWRGRLIR